MTAESASFHPPEPEAGGYARVPHEDLAEVARARLLLASAERSDLALYVGPNAGEYLRAFDLAQSGRRGLAVCWPAVFFGPAWLLYRKMFGVAALICAAPFVGAALHIGQDALRYVGLLPVIVGLVARPLYLAKARATIARLRSEGHSEAETRRLIAAAGGVSRAGAVIGALILLAPLTGFVPAFLQSFAHSFMESFQHARKAGQ